MRINLCLLTEKRKAAMAASLLRLRDYNGLILFRSLLAGIMMAIIHRAGIEGRNRRHSMLKAADGPTVFDAYLQDDHTKRKGRLKTFIQKEGSYSQ